MKAVILKTIAAAACILALVAIFFVTGSRRSDAVEIAKAVKKPTLPAWFGYPDRTKFRSCGDFSPNLGLELAACQAQRVITKSDMQRFSKTLKPEELGYVQAFYDIQEGHPMQRIPSWRSLDPKKLNSHDRAYMLETLLSDPKDFAADAKARDKVSELVESSRSRFIWFLYTCGDAANSLAAESVRQRQDLLKANSIFPRDYFFEDAYLSSLMRSVTLQAVVNNKPQPKVVYTKMEYPTVLSMGSRFLKQDPEFGGLQLDMGIALRSLNRRDEALYCAESGLKSSNLTPDLRSSLQRMVKDLKSQGAIAKPFMALR